MKEQPFHIGIKAIITNNGKVLILKDSGRYKGIDVPGGKIDGGEGISEALERELKEELGLTEFRQGEILGAHIREDYNKNGIRLMLIFYRVDAQVQDIKLSEEHSSFEWIGKADLDNLEFRNDGVKEAIEKVL